MAAIQTNVKPIGHTVYRISIYSYKLCSDAYVEADSATVLPSHCTYVGGVHRLLKEEG
jgi:hypothetical protein